MSKPSPLVSAEAAEATIKPTKVGAQALPTQAELAQLACLLDKGGNLPSKDLVFRAFEVWNEAGSLLVEEAKKQALFEGEDAARWADEFLDRSIPFEEIAKRGLLPSARTKTGAITSVKRVRQVLAEYQQHLKTLVGGNSLTSEDHSTTEADLAEVTNALERGQIPNQLLLKVKAHLEQKSKETLQTREAGKSLTCSSVPECKKPEKLLEPMAKLAERDNAKAGAVRKR